MSIPFLNICKFRFLSPELQNFQFTSEWSKLVKRFHFRGRSHPFGLLCENGAYGSGCYLWGGAIPITCAQVHSQSEHGHESEAWSLLTPLDETSRFVLLTGYSEGNSFHFKLTFNMSFQEKKKIKTKRGHWSTDGNHKIISPDDLKLQDTILTTSSCAPHSTNQLNRKCWDNQVYTDMPGRYTRLP